MNGPVLEYDLRRTTLAALKSYPPAIRLEFFKLMAEKFGATQAALAQELGCSQRNVGYYIAKAGVSDLFPIHRMTKEQRNALHEFFYPTDAVAAPDKIASTSGVSNTLIIDDTPSVSPETAEPEIDTPPVLSSPDAHHRPIMMMEEVKLQFTGEFLPQQVYNTLCSLLEPGTKCKISIACELVD